MPSSANSRPIRHFSLTLMVIGGLSLLGGLASHAVGDDAVVSSMPPAQVDATATQAPAAQPGTTQAPVSVQVQRAGASAAHAVSIVDYAFSPGGITVHAGDTVTWTNTGQDPKGHTVTGSGFGSGVLVPGATFSQTFTSAGTFTYVCSIHPNMHGSVTVAARAPAGPANANGSGGGGSGGSRGGSGSGASSAGTSGSAPSTTGAGSESAAVASPNAAGSAGSLPQTGTDSLGLATAGMLLIALGAALRLFEAARS